MTPQSFLDLLWQYKPEDLYVLLWTLQDKRSHWFQDPKMAAEFASAATNKDVYVGVGLSKADHGPARRCTSNEIAGIAGFGSDFDFRSAAHGNKPLPSTIEDALSVIPPLMPPTIVVATGNGAHAWWLFKEPYIFESEEERKDVARLMNRWHTMLRLRSSACGWAYDRLSDLARVLRIPGTLNHKDPRDPKNVVVHTLSDRHYNLSDFEELLDAAEIPDPEAEEKAAREWAERFADTPLIINTNARVPQETLDGWMSQDMRFRNTWLRQRHDLKDQSNSGYDMALACFGVDAGLSEQQIVDLIVHHRAHQARGQRTRLDYFQRTIAKATQRTGRGTVADFPAAVDAHTATATAPQGAHVGTDDETTTGTNEPPAADPATVKALLCKRISETLGIPVLRIVKITGKEPQYRMELTEGYKIEFPNVGKLISQDAVRVSIAATVGKIIPKIKKWDQIAQAFLDACIIEEGTEEMEWEGAARLYLQNYLSETDFIHSIEGQRIQEQRKPMVIDDKITLCASDFQVYVNRTTFQNLSVKAIAGMLSALGAKSIRVRGLRFKEQSRWVLPPGEFDPVEYRPDDGGDRVGQ